MEEELLDFNIDEDNVGVARPQPVRVEYRIGQEWHKGSEFADRRHAAAWAKQQVETHCMDGYRLVPIKS